LRLNIALPQKVGALIDRQVAPLSNAYPMTSTTVVSPPDCRSPNSGGAVTGVGSASLGARLAVDVGVEVLAPPFWTDCRRRGRARTRLVVAPAGPEQTREQGHQLATCAHGDRQLWRRGADGDAECIGAPGS
jgi:hypothetical protein